MDRTLLPEAEPVAIPPAAYPENADTSYSVSFARLMAANPIWYSLGFLDLMAIHDRSTSIPERQVLNDLASEAARRDEARANLTAQPAFPEAYMHDRPEPKAEPAARPAPHLYAVPAPPSPKVEHSPPCTTAAVIAIWDSYPELHKAGGLVPNRILAIRGDQLTFRKACEYAAKKLASGASVGSPAGLVHNTFKTMVARR
jgi:hypothetical protein